MAQLVKGLLYKQDHEDLRLIPQNSCKKSDIAEQAYKRQLRGGGERGSLRCADWSASLKWQVSGSLRDSLKKIRQRVTDEDT